MSKEAYPATSYRSEDIKVNWLVNGWRSSPEYASHNPSSPCYKDLFSPDLPAACGSKWKFVIEFESAKGINQIDRTCHFTIECSELPHFASNERFSLRGSIKVTNTNYTRILYENKSEIVYFRCSDRFPLERTPVLLRDLPDDLILKADLKIGGLCEPTSTIPHSVSDSAPTMELKSSLTPFLQCLAADSTFTDLTVVVGDQQFSAHRCVLSARSSVFRRMFASDMKESREGKIVLNDLSSRAWNIFRTFLYTDVFNDNCCVKTLLEVLMLSDKYDVQPLKDRAEVAIVDKLTPDNVVEVFEASHHFKLKMLQDAATKVIVENWEAMKKKTEVMTWMTSGSSLGTLLFEKLHF